MPGFRGVECAGLTPLPDGSVLLNHWQFGWRPPGGESAADLVTPAELARDWAASQEFVGLHAVGAADVLDLFPMARQGGRCLVSRAEGGGAPFEPLATIPTAPWSGGYGMRGGVVLGDGTIVLPLSDVPRYRWVFVVRSSDGGRSWSPPAPAAAAEGRAFEEPAPVLLPSGEILMLLRENEGRLLHEVRSADGGASWTVPRPKGIADYPAHLLRLRDGRLAMVAGRRRPPFGVTLYLSGSDGADWSPPFPVRDDLPDRDLGYPAAAQRADGDLFVLYYGREASGVTAILQTVVPAEVLATLGAADGRG